MAKASAKKAAKKTAKKSPKKSSTQKNKLGVKNSLVNNINAKKRKKVHHAAKKSQPYLKKIMTTWKIIGEKRNSIFTFDERFTYYFRN